MIKILLISLSFLLVSCPNNYVGPVVEDCIVGIEGDNLIGLCIDERLEEDKQEYDLAEKDLVNYRMTNAKDFATLEKYISELRTRLVKCENSN